MARWPGTRRAMVPSPAVTSEAIPASDFSGTTRVSGPGPSRVTSCCRPHLQSDSAGRVRTPATSHPNYARRRMGNPRRHAHGPL